MPDAVFQYVLLAALAIALAVAAFTDIRRREIDNWLNLAIELGAPLYWWASGLDLWPGVAWQLGIAAITFAALLGLFAMNAMGGGDVKLLTALALWITPFWFLRLLIVMSLLGGVLTLALWAWHQSRKGAGEEGGRIAVPYGVAISAAGLWALSAQFLPHWHDTLLGGALG